MPGDTGPVTMTTATKTYEGTKRVHAKPGHAAAFRAKEAPHEDVRLLPHIDMRAADGSMVIGWLASQTDMLAEDWMVLA